MKCFSPFVASWTAPCASGRSERWPGRISTDESTVPFQVTHNNSAERSIRPVVLGRRNYLFAGSDAGGERAANIYSLIGTAMLNAMDPYLYLRYVLERIADHPINRIEALLPWNVAARVSDEGRQAA